MQPRLGNNEGHYDGGDISQRSQLAFDEDFDFIKNAKTAAAFLKNNIGLAGLIKQEAPAGSVSQRGNGCRVTATERTVVVTPPSPAWLCVMTLPTRPVSACF